MGTAVRLRWLLAITGLALAAGAGAIAAPSAPPPPAETIIYPANSFEGRILVAHNRERARFGAAPLLWDLSLAQGAAQWANALARSGSFDHSDRRSRPGVGENLAAGTRGQFSLVALLDIWVSERALFTPGVFPNVSRTGNWFHVSHFTQMIWPTTTRVGCALAAGAREDVLVCRYWPKGNTDGRAVGMARSRS